jgi:50S ribosomal subunit-associated GTPase HflX
MRDKRRGEIIIVANKIDRLKQSERFTQINDISEIALDLAVIPFSSKTGEGKEQLLKRILA